MSSRQKKPKKFTIRIEKGGGIAELAANTPLDLIYKRMFVGARRSAQRNPARIENGIKTILFGCFWLEACANTVLHKVVVRATSNSRLGENIWQKMKNARFFDRLTLISASCDDKQLQDLKSLNPRLKKSFHLRNRLVHFKDEMVSLGRDITVEQVFEIIDNASDPELFELLTSPETIAEHALAISQGGKWLSLVLKQRNKIKQNAGAGL